MCLDLDNLTKECWVVQSLFLHLCCSRASTLTCDKFAGVRQPLSQSLEVGGQAQKCQITLKEGKMYFLVSPSSYFFSLVLYLLTSVMQIYQISESAPPESSFKTDSHSPHFHRKIPPAFVYGYLYPPNAFHYLYSFAG